MTKVKINNKKKLQNVVKTLKKIYPSNDTDSTSLNKVYLTELVGGGAQRHSKITILNYGNIGNKTHLRLLIL